MDRRKKYLKVLAFVPAIALVGGLIGCHWGDYHVLSKQPLPAAPAGTQQPPAAPAPEQAAPESKPPVFFSGAKSPCLPSLAPGGKP